MRILTRPLLLAACCISISCYSQNLQTERISGIVVNGITGEKLDHATVQLNDQGISVMSNEEGRFILKTHLQNKDQTIRITHIGFKPAIFDVRAGDTSFRQIKMYPEAIQLEEIIVKTINPLELLKSAISRIPENYPGTPFQLGGFYRLIGLKETRIIHLSEAVFDVNGNRPSRGKSQFRLLKSRVDKDLTAFNGADNVEMNLTPEAVMNFDIVAKITESEILNKQGLKNHLFYFRGIINDNGVKAYLIEFDEKDGIKQSLFRGRIVIGVEDLAFLEFDIYRSEKGINEYNWSMGMRINLGLSHIQAKLLSDHDHITYQKYGSKYYLNHLQNESRIYLSGGNKHFLLDPLVNKTEYLVTRVDTSGMEVFQNKDMLGTHQSIEAAGKTISDTRDSPAHSDTTDRFWESYNQILANFKVDSAIRVIQTNNAKLNLKKQIQLSLSKYGKDKSVRVDSILHNYFRNGQFNGTALIQYRNQIIFEKGFGLADQEQKLPNTITTGFRIGSTSKQFTAMLIMQLVHQNKLSVLDTVGKFLPGYRHPQITIQQLLTHQSGIPNYTAIPDYFMKIVQKKYPPTDLVSMFCSDSLEFVPGTQFHYSNSNYVLLADILEKVSGKSYGDLLTENIFEPLGMKNSYFVHASGQQPPAKGYVNGLPEEPYPIENVTGAGGITSTAADLLIWANALNTEKLLPREFMDEIFKPRVEWKDWDAYYGYGWMTDRDLFQVSVTHPVRYHPGTEFGFFDMLAIQPENGIVIILLNNAGDFPRFDMTDLILTELNR